MSSQQLENLNYISDGIGEFIEQFEMDKDLITIFLNEQPFNSICESYYKVDVLLQNTFANPKDIITVKKDSEKEYIEYDLDKMQLDKIYIINYQNDIYAMQKIKDDHVIFYDVI